MLMKIQLVFLATEICMWNTNKDILVTMMMVNMVIVVLCMNTLIQATCHRRIGCSPVHAGWTTYLFNSFTSRQLNLIVYNKMKDMTSADSICSSTPTNIPYKRWLSKYKIMPCSQNNLYHSHIAQWWYPCRSLQSLWSYLNKGCHWISYLRKITYVTWIWYDFH